MTHCSAEGLASTRSIAGAADWATLLVTTGMSVEAVIIHPTLHLDAGNIGVALVTLLTSAHRVVINNSAEGMVSTGTRVFTYLVEAGVSFWAVIISGAPGHDGRQGLAAVVLAGHVAVRTGADHCSDRQRVDDGAGGGLLAGAEGGAEQRAFVVQTGVLRGAVLVLDALRGGDGHTRHPGVASEADGAAALGLVNTDKTLSIRRTWILIDTRIDTVLVSACLVSWTLRVGAAANHFTSREWVSFIPWQTAAVGSVKGGVALSKSAARVIEQAGVDTFSLDAGLSVSALSIRLTSDGLTGDLGVAHISRGTDTGRPVIHCEALGSSSTVAWVLALSIDAGLAIGTVIISGTAGRVGELHRLAPGVRLRHPALSAAADHGPEGQAVDHGAHRRHVTRGQRVTRVGASLIEARGVIRAVSVSGTLGLIL